MFQLRDIATKGAIAVQRLRQQKLDNGLAFMIYSKDLPANCCYLEYPDGTIKLVTISKDGHDLTVVRNLNLKETSEIRTKYNLH
jgi:hypothetical protein